MKSIVNKAGKFDGSANLGSFKPKKLFYKYPSLENIKKGSRRIKANQDAALFDAFEKFKHVPDCIFYYKNYHANPSISYAVSKHKKKEKDDESDNFLTTGHQPKDQTNPNSDLKHTKTQASFGNSITG